MPIRALLGTLLIRLVIPAWITTGAIFKLVEGKASLLPSNIFDLFVKQLEIPGYPLLATIIALEFFAIAVMVFLGRYARAMAIFMMAAFCGILIGELVKGSASCGCLGANSPPPWLMLTIDGVLLLGCIFLRDTRPASERPAPKKTSMKPGLGAVGGFTLAGAIVAFVMVVPEGTNTPVDPDPVNPTPAVTTLPALVYIDSDAGLVGQPWRDVAVMQYLLLENTPERDLDTGTTHVVMYGRTCDHCEEMFWDDFAPDDDLARTVVAVEIPGSTDAWHGDSAWDMPETQVEHLRMPLGAEYIITTPLILTIEDGVVTCAKEGDHAPCMFGE